MTTPRPSPLKRLASWWYRLGTAARLQAFGTDEVALSPHEPFPDRDRPGTCVIDGLALDHPHHDRHLRKRRKARQGTGTAVAESGWR